MSIYTRACKDPQAFQTSVAAALEHAYPDRDAVPNHPCTCGTSWELEYYEYIILLGNLSVIKLTSRRGRLETSTVRPSIIWSSPTGSLESLELVAREAIFRQHITGAASTTACRPLECLHDGRTINGAGGRRDMHTCRSHGSLARMTRLLVRHTCLIKFGTSFSIWKM